MGDGHGDGATGDDGYDGDDDHVDVAMGWMGTKEDTNGAQQDGMDDRTMESAQWDDATLPM